MIDSFPMIVPSSVTILADETGFILSTIGEIDFLYRFLCVA